MIDEHQEFQGGRGEYVNERGELVDGYGGYVDEREEFLDGGVRGYSRPVIRRLRFESNYQ